jgi:glucosamine-phosphate N-acetyltransferase
MIRELELLDVTEDYFKLLCQLSGDPKETSGWSYASSFWLKYEDNEDHQTFVYEDEGRVIGTATVLIENKLLHYGSKVGHIEDVVVDKNIRKSGIGKALIKECIEFCRYKDCYKAILDCSKENIPFYECCGFTFSENCMRINLGEK